MDKRVLTRIEDEQKRLAISKIIDTVNLASRHYEAKFTHFLDPAVIYFAEHSMYIDPGVKISFWGGYEGAERRIMCAAPEWEQTELTDFPLSCIKSVSSGFNELTHRDYLGALMGLGIKREQIGDIVINGSCAYIFCKSDIFSYIMNNLNKVGRDGVRLCGADADEITSFERNVKQIGVSVASLRLDSVLAGVLNMSRQASADLVKSCKVKVNFDECENLSKILSCGDLISVRGFGRLKISGIGGTTKKGRTHIFVEKYL